MTLKTDSEASILAAVPASGVSPSPPVAKAAGVSISGAGKRPVLSLGGPAPDIRKRVALYVDGFNLYHAIDKLAEPHLKWLNLYALGERLLNRNEERLVRAYYVSAKKPADSAKNERHQQYINALKHAGVECQMGHFITEEVSCHGCQRVWDDAREKESDINLALAVIDDAYRNVFDVALVVTADSDQAATARMLKLRFPEKHYISIVPPGMEPSHAIRTYAPTRKLAKEIIEECLLPETAISQMYGNDITHYKRPASYAPPIGWSPSRLRRAAAVLKADAASAVT